ncbi:MAG: hypothetical protein IPM29_31040 [Planctomycetes bacterium]|nr:hypothetical protein [Planctomycetota bacterium]
MPGATSYTLLPPGQTTYLIQTLGTQTDIAEARYYQGFAASATQYGQGCPRAPIIYEFFGGPRPFDLSNTAFELQANATGGWNVSRVFNAAIDPNFASNRGLGDDQLAPNLPLGFSLPMNGALWDDLNPAAGVGVFFDQLPGVTMITWSNVPEFPNSGSNTVQVRIHPTGRILIVYGQVSSVDSLVGYSPGTHAADPGPTDLSRALPVYLGNGLPLTLGKATRPLAGTTVQLATTNLPPNLVLGAVVIGSQQVNLPLAAIGMDTCTMLSNADITSLPFSAATPTAPLPIPNSSSLLGVTIRLQSLAVAPGTNQLGVVTSNGLTLVLSNY